MGKSFLIEPISIKDINFEEIIIIPNKIEVLSEVLRGKQKQLVFHNYFNTPTPAQVRRSF
jgi:hypothetical protein